MVAPATILVGLAVCIASVLLVVVTAVSVYLVIVHRRYSHIPSPKGASFIKGHLSQIQLAKQKGKFFHVQLREWSEEVGLLYVIWLIHMPLVVVLDQAGIKDVSGRRVPRNIGLFNQLFGQRFSPRSVMGIAEYEEWKKVRKPYDPLFTRSVLKLLVPQFNLIAKRFVDVTLKPQADGKTVVDCRDHYRNLAMEAISMVAFGDFLEDPHVKSITAQGGSLLNLLDDVLLGFEKRLRNPMSEYMRFGENLQYAQSTRKVREIGEYVIRKRMQALVNKEEVPNDILTMILNSTQVEGNNGLEDMVDNFMAFFIAGQDTTANLLSFVTIMLNKYPEVLQRLMEEMEEVMGDKPDIEADDLEKLTYMTQVLEETLRLYPPVGGVNRESPTPDGVKLCDYYIPPGTTINVPIYAIHHSSLHYDDPLKFDPSRFAPGKQRPGPYVYLPFGLSHRMCIGRVFALMEAKVLLVHLLRAYSLHLTDDYVLQEELSITIHPRFGVPCTISPRHQ